MFNADVAAFAKNKHEEHENEKIYFNEIMLKIVRIK